MLSAKPVTNLMEDHNLQHHHYAVDTQLYKTLNHIDLRIQTTQEFTICHLKPWSTKINLQLKESKTQFVLSGKPSDLRKMEDLVVKNNSNENRAISKGNRVRNYFGLNILND